MHWEQSSSTSAGIAPMSLPNTVESKSSGSGKESQSIEAEHGNGIETLYQLINNRSKGKGSLKRSGTSGSRPLSYRSYSDGNGYTSFRDDENGVSAGQTDGTEEEKPFEVQWDGDHDPLNPRSFSTAKKWLIVVIVSMSSTCVYVHTIIIVLQFMKLIVIGPKYLCF